MHKELVTRVAVLFVLLGLFLAQLGQPVAAEGLGAGPEYHRIRFPVQEAVSYSDDFGAPRAGARTHEGTDLMGRKLDHELAATDGTVTWVKVDDGAAGNSGNMLTLKADDGWFFYYIHINNDSPGTDDAANPAEFRFAPGI